MSAAIPSSSNVLLWGGNVCTPKLYCRDWEGRQSRNVEIPLFHKDLITAPTLTRLLSLNHIIRATQYTPRHFLVCCDKSNNKNLTRLEYSNKFKREAGVWCYSLKLSISKVWFLTVLRPLSGDLELPPMAPLPLRDAQTVVEASQIPKTHESGSFLGWARSSLL